MNFYRRVLTSLTLLSCLLASAVGQAQHTFIPAIKYSNDYSEKVASSPEAEQLLQIIWGDNWMKVQAGASYLRLADNSYLFLVEGSGPILEGIYEITINPPRDDKLTGGSQKVLGAFSRSIGDTVILFQGVGYRRGYGFQSVSVATYGPSKPLSLSELLRIELDMAEGGCGSEVDSSDVDAPARPDVAGELISVAAKDLNGDATLDVVAEVKEVDCTTGATVNRSRRFFYREGKYVEESH